MKYKVRGTIVPACIVLRRSSFFPEVTVSCILPPVCESVTGMSNVLIPSGIVKEKLSLLSIFAMIFSSGPKCNVVRVISRLPSFRIKGVTLASIFS